VRSAAPWPARLIVEAETAREAEEALRAGADAVLLDGFTAPALDELVPRLRRLASERGAPVLLEASGIDPARLRSYAATGIDLISSSAPVTRSPWLDISMRFEPHWA
jgi:nicotinate-nucleotide pyrophosphorylase (carboxylating)